MPDKDPVTLKIFTIHDEIICEFSEKVSCFYVDKKLALEIANQIIEYANEIKDE